MALLKAINGHTSTKALQRYLDKDGRALARDYFNLSWDDREAEMFDDLDKPVLAWAAEMDSLRATFGNDRPYGKKPAITYRHYVVSPDPKDNLNLGQVRELAQAWALKHFADYQIAIVYHDDNESRIPHAHVVVNNTHIETGRRLHIPQPKELNRSLQAIAKEQGHRYFTNTPSHFSRKEHGAQERTRQPEYKTKAERRIEREGGYSWVADIRTRVALARTISNNEAEFKQMLDVMGIAVSNNSPKAARRDWIYSFAEQPSRKVGGEKLGSSYGKQALQFYFGVYAKRDGKAMDTDSVLQRAKDAIEIKDLAELRELAKAVEQAKPSREYRAPHRRPSSVHARSLEEYKRQIGHPDYQRNRGYIPESSRSHSSSSEPSHSGSRSRSQSYDRSR